MRIPRLSIAWRVVVGSAVSVTIACTTPASAQDIVTVDSQVFSTDTSLCANISGRIVVAWPRTWVVPQQRPQGLQGELACVLYAGRPGNDGAMDTSGLSKGEHLLLVHRAEDAPGVAVAVRPAVWEYRRNAPPAPRAADEDALRSIARADRQECVAELRDDKGALFGLMGNGRLYLTATRTIALNPVEAKGDTVTFVDFVDWPESQARYRVQLGPKPSMMRRRLTYTATLKGLAQWYGVPFAPDRVFETRLQYRDPCPTPVRWHKTRA